MTFQPPCSIDRGATSASYRPVVDDDSNYLTVVASYTDGHRSGNTAILTTTTVVVPENEDNVAPQFLDADKERITRDMREVREDAATNPDVGLPVTAMDDNTNNADDGTLVYTLSGTDARYFKINEETGQIAIGTGTTLDYETRKSYRVTVRALDSSAASAQITVTINVIDVRRAACAFGEGAGGPGGRERPLPGERERCCGAVHGNGSERQ